jgi:SAM-dependent methyltransferase
LWDRIRSLFNSPPEAGAAPEGSQVEKEERAGPREVVRHSHALEQMLYALRDRQGLKILDLGEVNQANVGFLTSLGHRLYSEDFLHTVDGVFGDGDPEAAQMPAARVEEFFAQALRFPPQHFDAALLWDTFEYLTKPLMERAMARLIDVVRPGGVMLACFHADVKGDTAPLYSYRIMDGRSIQLAVRGERRLLQRFNNRTIENVFQPCSSVKFFLTRDSLREVIVRR